MELRRCARALRYKVRSNYINKPRSTIHLHGSYKDLALILAAALLLWFAYSAVKLAAGEITRSARVTELEAQQKVTEEWVTRLQIEVEKLNKAMQQDSEVAQ